MNGTDRFSPERERDDIAPSRHDRSLGELFTDLSRETFRLVRQELEFAKIEMSRKVSRASRNSMYLVAGAAVVYAGFLSILAAVVLGLANFMPLSAAALLTGLVVAAIGLVMAWIGRKKLSEEDIAPREAIEALKGDKEWIKKQMM